MDYFQYLSPAVKNGFQNKKKQTVAIIVCSISPEEISIFILFFFSPNFPLCTNYEFEVIQSLISLKPPPRAHHRTLVETSWCVWVCLCAKEGLVEIGLSDVLVERLLVYLCM